MEIWTIERDWGSLLRKIIIAVEIVIIIVLLFVTFSEKEVMAVEEIEGKFYYMTVTAYSLHKIADKHNDGMTATMTPIREGTAAINVDYIDNKWLIKSPLNLGDRIYIERLGEFDVLDTGYFTDIDYKQDFWNVDIFIEDYQKALEFGRQLRKVYVLEG